MSLNKLFCSCKIMLMYRMILFSCYITFTTFFKHQSNFNVHFVMVIRRQCIFLGWLYALHSNKRSL
ncbi:hypothetical protein C1646_707039 [Rhizophagus diaphanus]|nr:hypothetical protein C1646_707039 [Rhizophagus diaphanus] [Rhizophagus sp. MUCL 43196]